VQAIMLDRADTHFVVLAQAVLFRGAGLDVVWPQLLALAAVGSALFWASLARFRRSLR
jgi:ABC-2 type transport system permease protein